MWLLKALDPLLKVTTQEGLAIYADILTLLYLERPKLYTILALLSAIRLSNVRIIQSRLFLVITGKRGQEAGVSSIIQCLDGAKERDICERKS